MQDTQFYFCMISLHQRQNIPCVSFLKRNVLQVRNVKGTPNFMQLFPKSGSFSHQKSIVESLMRNFWLRMDKYALTKVLRCFLASHDSALKYQDMVTCPNT